MSIKIYHTADLHIGLSFGHFQEKQNELVDARYETLQRMIDQANERYCDLFVIAGDMFDKLSVNKKEIKRAVSILKQFEGKLVLVLPGNHDYISASSRLWEWFNEEASSSSHIVVAERPMKMSLQAYELPLDLYPAPCHKRHSSENRLSEIEHCFDEADDVWSIGIAHGSVEGYTPDFNGQYFPMTLKDLKQSSPDFWLLGHTHVMAPENPDSNAEFYNPGIPEPDGFNCNHQGNAFMIELQEDKSGRSIEKLSVGTYRFKHLDLEMEQIKDLQQIKKTINDYKPGQLLLKVTLKGHLSDEEMETLYKEMQALGKDLFWFWYDSSRVLEKVSKEKIEEEFTEDSLPYRVLESLIRDEDELGAQKAYQLIKEARNEN